MDSPRFSAAAPVFLRSASDASGEASMVGADRAWMVGAAEAWFQNVSTLPQVMLTICFSTDEAFLLWWWLEYTLTTSPLGGHVIFVISPSGFLVHPQAIIWSMTWRLDGFFGMFMLSCPLSGWDHRASMADATAIFTP